jgi:hypothetical protein
LVESDDLARYDNARWKQVSDGSPVTSMEFTDEIESDGRAWDVPDGTVADVLEWVGDDPDRANAALEAEESGKRRKGVLDALT